MTDQAAIASRTTLLEGLGELLDVRTQELAALPRYDGLAMGGDEESPLTPEGYAALGKIETDYRGLSLLVHLGTTALSEQELMEYAVGRLPEPDERHPVNVFGKKVLEVINRVRVNNG